jgi:hypothetical protein
MSKYTIINDPSADSIVERDLSLIVKKIKNFFGNYVQTILLCGGFGRGEGGVVKEDGVYRPLNDYDLTVIVKKLSTIPEQLRNNFINFQKELDEIVHVKQVDIALIDEWKLTIPYPSIARYEIKNGYKLLYGKIPVIRAFPAWLLPLNEATTYYRTRSGGLLIASLLLDKYGTFTDKERIELIFLEINKAFLALGDAYLIKNRLYHFSYVKRKEIILKNKNKLHIPEEIFSLYLTAIENKLSPKLEKLTLDTIKLQWFLATKKIIYEFLQFESRRYKKKFYSINEYYDFTTNFLKFTSPLKSLSTLYNKEDSDYSIKLRLISMLLLSYNLNYNVSTLANIRQLLNITDNIDTSYTNLTIYFLKTWHPAGILEKILES